MSSGNTAVHISGATIFSLIYLFQKVILGSKLCTIGIIYPNVKGDSKMLWCGKMSLGELEYIFNKQTGFVLEVLNQMKQHMVHLALNRERTQRLHF